MSPGVAVVFGEVPDGMELIDLGVMPSFDRAQLSTVLGSIANLGTIGGNLANAATSAQGLYRVSDATFALLKSGGELATKDGAKLGAIFKNGDLVAQARFIPASVTAATAIAAIGPAVAMLALQMQLGEISGLVRTNIALTTQTLTAIRREQWSELEGLATAVESALHEARALGGVTETVWDPIAASDPMIRKHLDVYRKNVSGHIQAVGNLDGRARRQYLDHHAEAMVFDTHALLGSLKTYAGYQALRAAIARTRSADDEAEAGLFDRITRTTQEEIEATLKEIGQLTDSLVRELRIIAELPGRATLPLTRQRKDATVSQRTCAQILEAIEPLADMLHPAVSMPAVPDTVCAPEGVDLDPYLRVLRWFLEDGEELRGVAFGRAAGSFLAEAVVPAFLGRQVDAPWESTSSSTFIAVTDGRLITAYAKALLRQGEVGDIHPLDEVTCRRPGTILPELVRPTIEVSTPRGEVEWRFPATADVATVDALASLIRRQPIGPSALNEHLANRRAPQRVDSGPDRRPRPARSSGTATPPSPP
ncbi:hypothetical protein ACPCG0_06960 [Propionibacteriaceae bacterium Y1923]